MRAPRLNEIGLRTGDRAEVRCVGEFGWRPGTVTAVHAKYITTLLDEPVTLTWGRHTTTFPSWTVWDASPIRRLDERAGTRGGEGAR